ncbi:hypothetical protein [Kitasatospora sp. NPDC059571]|uniref:hypothetical protein n=1 Tax=Kitasatospora sp. NPDC059571 TaxID=3346871 RepID=UPI0036C50352
MGTVVDIAVAVVLIYAVLAILAGRPPLSGPAVAVFAVAEGTALWRAFTSGPGWLLWPAFAAAALWLANLVVGFTVMRRLRRTDPQVLREEVLRTATGAAPPQQLVLGVAPGGALMMQGVRPEGGAILAYGCPMCFVEEVVDTLVGPDAPVVAAYRRTLLGGTNRLFDLHRGVIDGRWHADLRPVRGPQRPYRPPYCPVHAS